MVCFVLQKPALCTFYRFDSRMRYVQDVIGGGVIDD